MFLSNTFTVSLFNNALNSKRFFWEHHQSHPQCLRKLSVWPYSHCVSPVLSIRSPSSVRLTVPSFCLLSMGSRTLCCSVPYLWNPHLIPNSDLLSTFKSRLKTTCLRRPTVYDLCFLIGLCVFFCFFIFRFYWLFSLLFISSTYPPVSWNPLINKKCIIIIITHLVQR